MIRLQIKKRSTVEKNQLIHYRQLVNNNYKTGLIKFMIYGSEKFINY